MLEIEIKVPIPSVDVMEQRLLDAGATFTCELIHEDHYFDKPLVMGTFAESDEALRLRISKNKTEGIEEAYFTYKGAKIDEETKTREELDVVVVDGEVIRQILIRLKFREALVVEKVRKIYDLKEVSITLDKVQYLDKEYMEVEVIAASEADLEKTRERLFSLLQSLGIERSASERRSYLELVLEKLQRKS